MAAFEQRDMSGSLFPIPEHARRPNGPTIKGSANIGGVDYWVSGWSKTSKAGNRWLSLQFERQEKKERDQAAPTKRHDDTSGFSDMADDIPF